MFVVSVLAVDYRGSGQGRRHVDNVSVRRPAFAGSLLIGLPRMDGQAELSIVADNLQLVACRDNLSARRQLRMPVLTELDVD